MSQTRLRRDIRALAPAERQRFFCCLKMLAILPPRQAANLRTFNVVWTRDQNFRAYLKPVKPINIHDELISSHQTTCQHSAPYFVYYHRHLLICLEIALNYAEEVLLGGKGSVPGDLYNRFPEQFDAVFVKYKDIISRFKKENSITGNLPTISIHYWNPTDFIQTLSIPKQLTQNTPNEIDNLYFAVNQHYAWNFNFKTRWFSDVASIPQGFINNGFFSNTPAYYTANEVSILTGKLNPRSDPQTFFNSSTGYSTLTDSAYNVNIYKNYVKFNQTKSTIDVCTLDSNQLNSLFGNKSKNLQWITQTEKNQMDEASQTQSYPYNKTLPHFQYSYSLFKRSNTFIKNYISTYNQAYDNSLENCHNYMHNNLQLFMSDAQVSITNLLFFLYHAWIDLALETKIRMIRTTDANSKQYKLAMDFMGNIKPRSVLDQPSGSPGTVTFGDYYIYQWARPEVKVSARLVLTPKDYQVAFKGKDYVINQDKKGIRRSDQLDQFYKKEYLPSNANRYAYFKGLSKFNYNYNYEVLDYNQKGGVVLSVMQGNAVPIPNYIRQIYNDYQSVWNGNKTTTLSVAKTSQVDLQAQPQGLVSNGQLSEIGFSSVQKYYDEKYLLRAIRASFEGYGTYAGQINSSNIPIILQLTAKGKKQLAIKKQHLQMLENGLIISSLAIFSRGNGALICPNCKEKKQVWISCSQNLAEMNEDLFCQLAKSINRQLIYQCVDQKETLVNNFKLSELMQLKTRKPIFSTLMIFQGALEVNLKVNFVGKQDFKTSSIKVVGYSYGVTDNKLFNIVRSKKENLSCEIQLARILSSYGQSSQQRYVYRQIKVSIVNGDEKHDFGFQINTYHQMIRYQIEIVQKVVQEKSYLNVAVKDRDFKFKEKHFNSSQYDI